MKIYFLGICGTAMGNAALLARASGHEVEGADSGIYPPMSTVLRQANIRLHEGYDPARLASLAPDLVVVGNAMSRGNPEVEWLLDSKAVRFTSLPALLHETVLARRDNIVVCGTHGKTTTTSLAAFLLRENGRDPGFLIGGVPMDPPVGSHLGALPEPFVIEGDEYDSAFFDKRSKFIHYSPKVAVINNLEFDHADIFRDLADVQRTFSHLVRIVPKSGWVIVNGDDDNLRALGAMPWTQVLRVGVGEQNDVRISDFCEDAKGAGFKLAWAGAHWAQIQWAMPGLFNARNAAMAATAAALLTPGGHAALRLEALQRFRGVRRRQETLVAVSGLTIIEDFGHHPTALAETLTSLRARHPQSEIFAVFEPRSNTARTRVLQGAFMRALAMADEVFIGAVNRADKLRDDERFDVDVVIEQLGNQGINATTAASNARLLVQLRDAVGGATFGRNERVVVFFSNGSFDGIIGEFARWAAGRDGNR